jgi:hypothetical protein
MATPTKTTNRIHFEDLENRRFEDLAQNIVHKLRPWIELNHVGRVGNDEGVDIEAIENDEGTRKRWVIQCKRYQTFSASHATTAIDEGRKDGKNIDVFLLVVGCDVSKATHTDASAHGAACGIAEVRIWDASYLESTLYNDRQDLLFIYFGIDIKGNVAKREAIIKRRVQMGAKLKKAFLLTAQEMAKRGRKDRAWEWNQSSIIIRDVNDETYPVVEQGTGISPWFKVQPLDFYHNGIRVVLRGCEGLVFEDDQSWELVESYGDITVPAGAVSTNVYVIGKIPCDNIVSFTTTSDEYGHVTIFCRFANGGAPYEVIEHAWMYGDGEGFPLLDPAKRRKLA